MDTTANSLVQGIDVVNNDVGGAARFAVAGVLSQKQRPPVEGESAEHRKPRFKLMLPLETEAKAIDVEGLGSRPVRAAKLRSDEL